MSSQGLRETDRGREQRSPQNRLSRVGEDILLHVPGYTAPPVKKYSSMVTRYKTRAKTNTMTAMLARYNITDCFQFNRNTFVSAACSVDIYDFNCHLKIMKAPPSPSLYLFHTDTHFFRHIIKTKTF